MTDDEFEAEVRRRLDPDNPDGGYSALGLHVAVNECGYTLEELGPDTPRRMWVLTSGNWSSPRSERYAAEGAPLVFLAGDEFGNRTLCVRLPGKRLLVLNLGWPMSRELWEPTAEEIAELERRVANDNGVRHSLDDVLRRSGITSEELEDEA